MAVLIATGSCQESDQPPEEGLHISLADGNSDQYGALPKTVDGWNVTRGAAAGYVSDESCSICHEAIYKSYQAMGMARSFYRLVPATVVEDLGKTFHHELTGRYYEMFERDGKYYQKRYCKDKEGRPYAEFEAEVAWVIGSGNHVRSYLSQTEHGQLHQLPLSWYTEQGWGMSPGYDQKNHSGFEREITRGCMFCHNAYPETPVGSDLHYKPNIFPHELPHGIGCQRCHGPGARHVEKATDPDSSNEEVRSRILNPARFTPQQRDDLCMTCHLQPEALAACELMPRSFSRLMFSQLPGQALTDFITYLDHGTLQERRQRIQVNGHAYRMRWSRCHSASDGKLTCLTCHDPHRKVPPAEQADFYRKKCMQCHKLTDCQMEEMGSTRDPGASDCVSCHMVKVRPEDVVHVTITDHFIRRFPPNTNLTAPRKEHGTKRHALEIVPYFPKRSGEHPLWKLYAGFGSVNAPTAEAMQRWRLAFQQTGPHTVGAYVDVGQSLRLCGDHGGAIALLTEGVEKFPNVAEVHCALGEALWVSGQLDLAVARLEKAHELDRTNPSINRSLADVYSVTGQLPKARAAYERSLNLRPVNWLTWRQYAATLVKIGDLNAAVEAFRRAIALNPDDEYAFYTMGSLFAAQRRWKEMFGIMKQGATHLLEMKLHLIVAYLQCGDRKFRDTPKGLAHAVEAVREHEDNARCHLHLALAMIFADKGQEAAAVIDTARAKGGDPACCDGLLLLDCLRRGDQVKARQLRAKFERALQDSSNEPLRGLLVGLVEEAAEKQKK